MSRNLVLFSFGLLPAAVDVRGSLDPARKVGTQLQMILLLSLSSDFSHIFAGLLVYMGGLPDASVNVKDEHNSLLLNAIGEYDKNHILPLVFLPISITITQYLTFCFTVELSSASTARNSLIHSYQKSFNGFAARLLPNEMQRLSSN